MLPAAIAIIVFAVGMDSSASRAEAPGAKPGIEERSVEFHNRDVTLAGSLLLPRSEVPVPAVVFIHGAGRQTRKPYREIGEHFASQGIAALIYDKRGTGRSGGAYESHEPYENLVNDARSAVAFLKQRPEIGDSPVGLWGLSQGASIGAAAASRSGDIRFLIVVGANVADGQMFYYRDNLFRRYGLSDTLRDVAEKVHLAQFSLPHNSPDGLGLSSFSPRSYPPPGEYVHPAWSQVHQPVLAMWGQLDQNVPVGESVAGLKNSLARAGNDRWTAIVLPRTNHDLQTSETGVLQSESAGYPPGALQTMTDWAWRTIDHPSTISRKKQEGVPLDAGILPRLASYERLRWYGNGTTQAALWILFLIGFSASTIAGARCWLARLSRRQQREASSTSDRRVNFIRAIAALNLVILIGLTMTAISAADQLHPHCPSALRYLPLLGTISMLATAALMIVLARTPPDQDSTTAGKIWFAADVLCLVLFVPYLVYWNAIGLHL